LVVDVISFVRCLSQVATIWVKDEKVFQFFQMTQ